jgi:hypothetical protein
VKHARHHSLALVATLVLPAVVGAQVADLRRVHCGVRAGASPPSASRGCCPGSQRVPEAPGGAGRLTAASRPCCYATVAPAPVDAPAAEPARSDAGRTAAAPAAPSIGAAGAFFAAATAAPPTGPPVAHGPPIVLVTRSLLI